MKGHQLIPTILVVQCLVAQLAIPLSNSERASAFVQGIIQKEFEGKIPTRNQGNIYMTNALKRKIRKEPLALCFFPDADPLFVVDSYKVLPTVTSSKGIFSVAVDYSQLARTEGKGNYGTNPRKLMKDVRPIQLVYRVRILGGHCSLVEPPPPCLSKSALIAIYTELISANPTTKAFQIDLDFLHTL